jgi:hypothetical protein
MTCIRRGWVGLVRVPPEVTAGPERIEIRVDDRVIGDVDLRVCPQCRVAVLTHVRVSQPYRRRGLATAAVRASLAYYPGYRWSTSPIDDTDEARGFWHALTFWPRRLGDPAYCQHMHDADQRIA